MGNKVWQFVERPENPSVVILNMNEDNKIYIDGNKDFKLDAPDYRRVWTDSPITDGSELSTSSYGNRDLVFTLFVNGTSSTQKGQRLNQILAAISKPGVIRYQLDGTMEPVFFLTFPSDTYKVTPRKGGPWSIELAVTARPFAIGLRRDLSLVTVRNDPTATGGVKATRWTVTGIEGDYQTPVFAKISATARALLTWRTKDDPTVLEVHAGAEEATMGTDTLGNGLDTTASGDGGTNNPVQNPGFEGGPSAPGWTPTAGTIIGTTAQFKSGTSSGRYDATATSGTRVVNSNTFVFPENTAFNAGAWVRLGAGPMNQARVNVRFFNSVGGTISTITGSFVSLTTTFQNATVAGTSPVGTVGAHVRVEGSPDPLAVASHLYIDDVTFSPGSNHTKTTFVNAGLVNRLTVTLPKASNAEALRGTYRVLVRIKPSAAGSTYVFRYRQNPGGSASTGPIVTYVAPNSWAVVDLGVIEFPGFPVAEYFGHSKIKPGISETAIGIEVQRTAGTADLFIDYVYTIPCSEGYCSIAQNGSHPWIILDGPNRETYGMGSGANPFGPAGSGRLFDNGGRLLTAFGQIPLLTPGASNEFFFVRTDSVAPSNEEDIIFSYWPYWKWVPTS